MLAGLKRKLVKGAASAVLVLMPMGALAETLTDAMISAYKHSGLLEQNRALLRSADEDVAVAVAGLRPTLNYVAQWAYADGSSTVSGDDGLAGSIGLTSSLLLYDFGASKLRIDMAKETVLATRDALTGGSNSRFCCKRSPPSWMCARLPRRSRCKPTTYAC